MVKHIKNKLSGWWYLWKWLLILDSPFKTPRVKVYFGNIAIGTPYFLPRKWVPLTEDDVMQKVNKTLEIKKRIKELKGEVYEGESPETRESLKATYSKRRKPVPKKFGVDVVGLGWKPKFDSYRFEWSPMVSFVGFGKQLCLLFGVDPRTTGSLMDLCYWEAWLYYTMRTDPKQSKTERLKATMSMYSAKWTNRSSGEEKTVNYYKFILKDKYLWLIDNENEV